jgi:predicted NAD-dependent protein-ADP-ribosyltransferase YbiA (DUF1768 family)
MVFSKLKPELEYNESKKINTEDEGFSTFVYQVELLETRVIVGIGKIKYTYTGKDIFYYLVYLIENDKVKSQIGVLELTKNEVAKYILDDNVDLEKFANDGNSFLLYSFVTKEFLSSSSSSSEDKQKVDQKYQIQEDKIKVNQKGGEEEDEDEEKKDVTELHFKNNPKVKEKELKITGDIFEDILNADIPDLLKEETKSDADKLKNKSANLNWIQKFMKNDNYRIQSIPKDGDSFFSTILYAFKQIGKKTTIENLRNIVAEAVNIELLEQYSSIYNSFNNEISDNQHKINITKKNISQTKDRYKNTNDIATNKILLEQIGGFKDDATIFQKYIQNAQPTTEHFKFMKDVHTIGQLRAKIMESSYLADDFAISKIEEKLNIKLIVLSKDKYDDGDDDGVMMCSSGNGNNTKPEYYIMVSFDGTHYDLISYKDKKILKFLEIPYYIKTLVVNKCIERNAGVFHHISDFRDFQTKFGIDPLNNSYDSGVVISELYDDNIHFMFYTNSANSKPGKGNGEKIDSKNLLHFKELQLSKNWRRQLDDEFVSPFMLDHKQWQTVEHYYQASKFKKGFPDFYASFSLDSGSEISNDVKKAKAAGGKSGRFEKELLRPNNVKLDADFYGGRDAVERKNAVVAKFEQNDVLKKMLIKTKKAKLLHFVRGSEPEIDKILMEVRHTVKP